MKASTYKFGQKKILEEAYGRNVLPFSKALTTYKDVSTTTKKRNLNPYITVKGAHPSSTRKVIEEKKKGTKKKFVEEEDEPSLKQKKGKKKKIEEPVIEEEDEPSLKQKKGRKKKIEEPVIEEEEDEPSLKQKKGRKKKIEEPVIEEDEPSLKQKKGRKKKIEEPVIEEEEDEPSLKQKKGRKKKIEELVIEEEEDEPSLKQKKGKKKKIESSPSSSPKKGILRKDKNKSTKRVTIQEPKEKERSNPQNLASNTVNYPKNPFLLPVRVLMNKAALLTFPMTNTLLYPTKKVILIQDYGMKDNAGLEKKKEETKAMISILEKIDYGKLEGYREGNRKIKYLKPELVKIAKELHLPIKTGDKRDTIASEIKKKYDASGYSKKK
jgi:hypothetical protein